ncbi:MAG: sigma-70 family RNA polymerase sigma factor [Verrucomicrobiales bacterium]|nr:sigma-70 family RNA polymerase sigma factor [Verrucomicrobiales bacterium]
MATTQIDSSERSPADFVETTWNLVFQAGQHPSEEAARAREALCRIYWYPVYAFLRRKGYGVHEAQDFTQELFARLLQKNSFARVDRYKGKFRSYLIGALQNILADGYDKDRALKRGGGQPLIHLDAEEIERRFLREGSVDLSPEKLFERRWASALLESALGRLRGEFVSAGKPAQFELLEPFLTREVREGEYEAVAERLKMKSGAVAVSVHRFRRRYQQLVRMALAQTVSDVSDVEEEARALFS